MPANKCLNCGSDEGTLLKEFQEQPEKNWSWYELSEMTPVCVSCGSENLEQDASSKYRLRINIILPLPLVSRPRSGHFLVVDG